MQKRLIRRLMALIAAAVVCVPAILSTPAVAAETEHSTPVPIAGSRTR